MASTKRQQVELNELTFLYPGSSEAVLQNISLNVSEGETLVLLGESGCGKTTLLRCIAGLERPDSGSISLDGKIVSSESSFLAPEKRNIGMVFQQWALFPHMNVETNIAYGIKGSKADKAATVAKLLEQVGLSGFQKRKPASLSGGQQQRVALARALAPQPSVLLLDEPFSNLDAAMRVRVRGEVHQLLKDLGITSIFVTHDQEEAFVLGDRVAVLSHGQLLAVDTPRALYREPATVDIAKFLGEVNLLGADNPFRPSPSPQTLVAIRPEQFELSKPTDTLRGPNGSGIEGVEGVDGAEGVVSKIEFYGHDCLVHVRLLDQQILLVRTDPFSDYSVGEPVRISLKDHTEAHIIDVK